MSVALDRAAQEWADALAPHGVEPATPLAAMSRSADGRPRARPSESDCLPDIQDMRMVRRMPRVQEYLPDDLHDELKKRGLPASELLQIALRAELERQDALDETARYLEELVAEVGEPSTRQQSLADAIAPRIRDRSLHRVS